MYIKPQESPFFLIIIIPFSYNLISQAPNMALSLPCKLCFLAAFAFLSVAPTYARDFSIVGYAPDDLTCIDKLINLFESWVDKHSKKYKSIEEKLHRFELFKDNLKHIDERNKAVSNYWLALNEFADLSHDEFKNMYLGLKSERIPKRNESLETFKYRDFQDLPKSVDWRKKGAVTRVKNQGSCGTCVYGDQGCKSRPSRPPRRPLSATNFAKTGIFFWKNELASLILY